MVSSVPATLGGPFQLSTVCSASVKDWQQPWSVMAMALWPQAAAWGHRAIAITDHGCCQSFTDALHTVESWKGPPKVAGTDKTIKILYGCEGYYVNDVDDRIVVHGTRNISFDDEFVAFDLETTGLSSRDDRIIEIGAVIMKNGEEVDRFQTFVDPQRPLEEN